MNVFSSSDMNGWLRASSLTKMAQKKSLQMTKGDLTDSVTRLGDLLHFGQLFKACGNNYFAQIDHIWGNFCKGDEIFHFSNEIIFGQLL